MPTYFPYLRGKQQEMIALRQLKERLAIEHSVKPIVELVNSNTTTLNTLDACVVAMTKFVLVTNPKHGQFEGREQDFYNTFVHNGPLEDYDKYFPALHIYRDTGMREVKRFLKNYDSCDWRAVIYNGEPASDEVREWCSTDQRIYYHIVRDGNVTSEFAKSFPISRRVILRDNFKRQARNADYPTIPELFTDMTTPAGNPDDLAWGDYSIVGDYYSEKGGPAMAVAIHHVHYGDSPGALYVSHFLSDRQETTADTPGKTMEAVDNLVKALDSYEPNLTDACSEYRRMAMHGESNGLPYLKRLGILHHLELMLDHEQ